VTGRSRLQPGFANATVGKPCSYQLLTLMAVGME